MLIIFPRRRSKERGPVVWLMPIFALCPDVVISLGVILAAAGAYKPRMLVGGVVYNQIHKDLYSP